MRKWGGGCFWNPEWASLPGVPSPHCTKHTGKLTWLPRARFLWCVCVQWSDCLYLEGNKCNKNETFSLNTLIKITYWIGSKTTGATFNLLCLLFGDLVHRGSRGHGNISGNPDRTHKRRCLFFLGIFKMP